VTTFYFIEGLLFFAKRNLNYPNMEVVMEIELADKTTKEITLLRAGVEQEKINRQRILVHTKE
jgi:hypothetical protein